MMSESFFLECKIAGFADIGSDTVFFGIEHGSGALVPVIDGVNGHAAFAPTGVSEMGRVTYGGMIAAMLEAHADNFRIVPLSGSLGVFGCHALLIPKDHPRIISEEAALRKKALRSSWVVIGRCLEDSIAFSTKTSCVSIADSSREELEKAWNTLAGSDADCESGAVGDIDSFAESVICESERKST